MTPDVSVIIVNYNTSALIADCLRSIFHLTKGITFEIIIADNNSEKDLELKLRSSVGDIGNHCVKYLLLPENIGFGRANNEGWKMAQGRNILFLNPDTILINNAIKILSDFLDSNNKAGACGGNLYDAAGNPTLSFRRWLPGWLWETDELFNTIPQRLVYGNKRLFNPTDRPLRVAYITGADLMVKKEVLALTDGFHKDFFMYYEETDLCARIKKHGWKIFNVPEAKIIHLEGGSFGSKTEYPKEHKIQWLENGRKIYYKNNCSVIYSKTADLIYSLYLSSRIWLVKNQEKKNYYRKRKEYFNSHDNDIA